MEKGDVEKYLIIVLVFVGLAAIVLVLRPSPTGYAVFEGYTNQSDCEAAGYTWEELTTENCTIIPDCVECAEGCLTEGDVCMDGCVESCVKCSADCLACDGDNQTCKDDNCIDGCVESCDGVGICVPGCVLEEEFCVDGCAETCEECVDVVTGGQCVGDVCDSDNLNLCIDYDGCVNTAGGYWYDDDCHVEQCAEDDDCDSGLVCTTDNVCCEPDCLGKECGDDGCGESCGDCASDEYCESGTCEEEEEEEESSSSSSETTKDEGKNLELSGQDKVLVSAGSSEEAELHVVNVGKYQLNCEMANENWISSEEKIEYLNKEEEVDIKYIVSVPTGTDAGDYSKELIVKCTGAISESKIIDITVVAGEGLITGEVISESGEEGSRAGITGLVIGEGRGRVIAYVVFLLVLVCAVVLVWRRHAQIKGLDGLLFRGKEWFNTKFHKEK